jgi:hypothetical protein
LVVLTVTTLFGWFTVSIDGEEVAWYWLLAVAFGLGAVGLFIDRMFENATAPDPEAIAAFDRRMQELDAALAEDDEEVGEVVDPSPGKRGRHTSE